MNPPRDDRPILLVAPVVLGPLAAAVGGAFRVEHLWELADLPAFLAEQGEGVKVVLTVGEHPLDIALLEALPNLGLIACFAVGYDHVPVDWCRARGVAVSHSPAVNADDVADHAVAAAISAWRGVVDGDRLIRGGRWTPTDRGGFRRSLGGRKVGIVGLGHIGAAIARRMEAFRTEIAWWGPNPKPDVAWPRVETLIDLAHDSDLLFVAVRAGPSNRGLIDAAVIEAVGPQGLICNVSRGAVVDQAALIAALKSGALGYAALDVFDPEPTSAELWRDVPNTVLTPHIAGGTDASLPAMVAATVENLRRFTAGEPLLSPIPELALDIKT
jgi:lactate dehydrogenase-like 2-hydroxyacid dehydrogenase